MRPAPAPSAEAEPHAGPPGTVSVQHTGTGATHAVSIEPHPDATVTVTGALAIQDINTITRQAHVDMPGMIPLHEGIRLLPAHNYPAGHTPGSADDNVAVGR